MITKKVANIGTVVAALVLGFSAHAEAKRYLVQFKSPAAFFATAQGVAAFTKDMKVDGVQRSQVRLFNTSAMVTGTLGHVQMMVIESDDALTIASLRTRPEIALIEQEVFHPAPAPISTHSLSGDAAMQPSSSGSNGSNLMPWGITAVKAPGAWATTKGAGARVVVLDTGIDQGHPAVAGQIEAVQNFTGGNATDVTDTVGHGTHVSGTILADGRNGLTGVAPEARLLMGKVCTDLGCSSVALVSGLDWAAQQKADVVNMSLGGGYSTPAETVAMANVESAGVVVIAASGNDAKPIVSYPAAYKSALAVGAVNQASVKADFSNWGPELGIVAPGVDVVSSVPRGTGRGATVLLDLGSGKGLNEILSAPFVGSPVNGTIENELVFAGLGKPTDFASVDVTGKLAFVQRGEIAFKDKVNNAIKAGAIGIVIFNNAPGMLQGTISDDGTEAAIPAVLIEQTVGDAAKQQLASGGKVRASISVDRTDFASFQGTSMATPHVSGVAALVRAANKTLTPAQVRAILKSTATALSPNDQNQMGSGLVNADAAVAKALQTFTPEYRIAN